MPRYSRILSRLNCSFNDAPEYHHKTVSETAPQNNVTKRIKKNEIKAALTWPSKDNRQLHRHRTIALSNAIHRDSKETFESFTQSKFCRPLSAMVINKASNSEMIKTAPKPLPGQRSGRKNSFRLMANSFDVDSISDAGFTVLLFKTTPHFAHRNCNKRRVSLGSPIAVPALL